MDRLTARYPALLDAGLLLARLSIGITGVIHGSQKLFGAFGGKGISGFIEGLGKMGVPMPEVSAYMAAISEFGGGLLLIIGLVPRVAAFFFGFTMLVAFVKAHSAKLFGAGNGEHAFNLMMVAFGIMLAGAGRFSIAGLLGRRTKTPAKKD